MPSKTDLINKLLTRSIEGVIPSKEAFAEVLESDKRLVVYLGIDPTGPQLHLGHSVPLLLLKGFQNLGHTVVLLVGDFTARIGDPSGKASQRKPLRKEEVLNNAKTYKRQAGKILDFTSKINPVKLQYNSSWYKKLTFEKALELASRFTVQQMFARDMFQERIKNESSIGLNEFLYPLMQGYDSVALQTDVEVGASDQLFNMLVGRDLVKEYLRKEKFVVTTRLLANPVTGAKMSKSEGNFVALDDPPSEMFGKIMAFPDELIKECFELCTQVPMEQIKEMLKLPPREAKAGLAQTIVAMYHGEDKAKKSAEEFNKVFSANAIPSSTPTVSIKGRTKNILDLLVETKLASSKSEARRLIGQGGVRINNAVVREYEKDIPIETNMIIRVGRRRIAKILGE